MCADTSQSLLSANAISMYFGDTQALHNLDLSINAGDSVGLLGLNGAGKSTLLKILAGVHTAYQGDVSIAGMSLQRQPIEARRLLGYAPDTPPVYPEFTVREYLNFAARLRGLKGAALTNGIARAVELCQLGEVEKRVIGNLSHGYQQRINLAQAMVHQPRLLILDEPTNGLDPAQLIEIRSVLQNLESHQATVFSSHQLAEVQANCRRVVLIDSGRKILDLQMDQLTDESHSTFEVRLKQPASSQDFQNLPGFIAACSVDPRHWLLTLLNRGDNNDGFGEMMRERGVELHKIAPVRNHLETLFGLLKLKTPAAVGEAT